MTAVETEISELRKKLKLSALASDGVSTCASSIVPLRDEKWNHYILRLRLHKKKKAKLSQTPANADKNRKRAALFSMSKKLMLVRCRHCRTIVHVARFNFHLSQCAAAQCAAVQVVSAYVGRRLAGWDLRGTLGKRKVRGGNDNSTSTNVNGDKSRAALGSAVSTSVGQVNVNVNNDVDNTSDDKDDDDDDNDDDNDDDELESLSKPLPPGVLSEELFMRHVAALSSSSTPKTIAALLEKVQEKVPKPCAMYSYARRRSLPAQVSLISSNGQAHAAAISRRSQFAAHAMFNNFLPPNARRAVALRVSDSALVVQQPLPPPPQTINFFSEPVTTPATQ